VNENPHYSQQAYGPYELHPVGDLRLEKGGTIRNCQLAVATFRALNSARDNAILVPTWYSGASKIIEQVYIDEGLALDPTRYFIVVVNQIGNGLSTSPHTSALPGYFPKVRIGGDVNAQHKLLTEKFGIDRLALVVGGSMGAQQTYEWAVRYPDMVRRAAPIWPCDFYKMRETLPAEDQDLLADLRGFLETRVAPDINTYWTRAEFPHHLVPEIARLGIVGASYKGYGFRGGSPILDGFIALELARVDCSIAAFVGVHGGLSAGSIYLCGSDEQKQRWLSAMARMEKLGSFGLTEPEVGSGAAGGLTTTCRRDGDDWVLNGAKRWIGNVTFADLNVIWARDVDDRQVKGFVVEKGTPGFSAEVMKDKIALRVVQNAMITLTDCPVPGANKLANANSFADTARFCA
jgi:pimeloyl-ACP methyl ester carboxylesterase